MRPPVRGGGKEGRGPILGLMLCRLWDINVSMCLLLGTRKELMYPNSGEHVVHDGGVSGFARPRVLIENGGVVSVF